MLRLLTILFLLSLTVSMPNGAETEAIPEVCKPYLEYQTETAVEKDYSAYPYADGLLWKVEKDGKTNYVYGTIHTQDQRATRFSPQTRLAIFRSEVYLMEVELSQGSNEIFEQAMFYTGDESLEDKLDPTLFKILQHQVSDYGYTADDAKRMKPWAAYSTISRPKPIRALTLDQVLMNYAVSRSLQVIGIETMQELVATLDSTPLSDQMTILADTICNRPKIIRETWNLVQMHMFGDLLGMVKFNEQPHHDEVIFQRYMQTVVYDRNQRMLDRILPYFEQGGAFAAIGALHLPGEKGLLKLLADNGFTVEIIR